MMKGTRERERKQNRLVIRLHFSFRSSVFDRARRETRERMRILSYLSSSNLPLLFSAIKKTKTLSSSSSFSPCFCSPFFFLLFCARNTLPTTTTMDNKSEILEQKKQSETALASARANAEQRWKRGNQSERISSRVISVRFIRVPLSFSPKNRAQRAGWLLRISPFLYGGMFLSPLFVLPFAYKKSTKNRAKIIKKHSENETANTYALRQLARERRFSRKPSKISSKKSSVQRQRGMKIE